VNAPVAIAPRGWHLRRLSDVAKVVGGSTPESGHPEFWGGEIIWVTPTDLGQLTEPLIRRSARKITDAGYRSCSAEMLPVGTVVMSSRAPIGHLGIAAVPLCTNQGCKSFTPTDDLDSQFLFYALSYFREAIESLGSGNTFKEVSKSDLESFAIPIPDLDEQKRIASSLQRFFTILRNAMDAAEKRSLRVTELQSSVVDTVFDTVIENTTLKELKYVLTTQNSLVDGPFGSNLKTSHYAREGARVIRLQNIGTNIFLNSDKAYIPLDYYEQLEDHDAREHDVLVASLGDGLRPAGRSCVVPNDLGPAIVKADCFRIRPDNTVLNSSFLCYFINSKHGRSQIQKFVQGATRPRLTLRNLRTLQVPVVNLAEQERVVALLHSDLKTIDKINSSVDSQMAHLENLYPALLRAAFSGQL
jgi:type I restriction enzyme S subunit